MAPTDKPEGGIKRKPVKRKAAAAKVKAKPKTRARKTIDISQEVVEEAPKQQSFLSTYSVRNRDITVFLRQLIMLLEAGTPILKSLNTLALRGQTAGIRGLVGDVAQYVEAGNPLWQAFERHPKHFDPVFINLVRASEASGTLVTILERLVKYRSNREIMNKRIQGALFYPVILVLACLGVMLFISMVVVPEFKAMFDKLNMNLPIFTQRFIFVSDFLAQYWWAIFAAVFALIAIYKLWYVRNPLRRITADRVKLNIPIIGNIILKTSMVEFSRTLSLLLRSGLSMMATLDLVRNTIHNQAVAYTLRDVSDAVETGEGIEAPLRNAPGIFPPVVTDMLVTGEEAGKLDDIAEQIADVYDEEVNIAIITLGESLQPILTIILGIVVVLLMLAVFVPMIGMLDQLQAG